MTIKERPILFSGPMVRAIIEGRKTQTRRVIACDFDKTEPGRVFDYQLQRWMECPYGKPGDRLWVRETFRFVDFEHADGQWSAAVQYEADGARGPRTFDVNEDTRFGARPSIHMPRWASRIMLEVTEVRVERLQEISELDAQAEGVTFDGSYWRGGPHRIKGTPKCMPTPASAFHDLWDSINAKRGHGLDSNPWVWVFSFKVLEGGR